MLTEEQKAKYQAVYEKYNISPHETCPDDAAVLRKLLESIDQEDFSEENLELCQKYVNICKYVFASQATNYEIDDQLLEALEYVTDLLNRHNFKKDAVIVRRDIFLLRIAAKLDSSTRNKENIAKLKERALRPFRQIGYIGGHVEYFDEFEEEEQYETDSNIHYSLGLCGQLLRDSSDVNAQTLAEIKSLIKEIAADAKSIDRYYIALKAYRSIYEEITEMDETTVAEIKNIAATLQEHGDDTIAWKIYCWIFSGRYDDDAFSENGYDYTVDEDWYQHIDYNIYIKIINDLVAKATQCFHEGKEKGMKQYIQDIVLLHNNRKTYSVWIYCHQYNIEEMIQALFSFVAELKEKNKEADALLLIPIVSNWRQKDVLCALSWQAGILESLCRREEALEIWKQVEQITQKTYGSFHYDTIAAEMCVARKLVLFGRYGEARTKIATIWNSFSTQFLPYCVDIYLPCLIELCTFGEFIVDKQGKYAEDLRKKTSELTDKYFRELYLDEYYLPFIQKTERPLSRYNLDAGWDDAFALISNLISKSWKLVAELTETGRSQEVIQWLNNLDWDKPYETWMNWAEDDPNNEELGKYVIKLAAKLRTEGRNEEAAQWLNKLYNSIGIDDEPFQEYFPDLANDNACLEFINLYTSKNDK